MLHDVEKLRKVTTTDYRPKVVVARHAEYGIINKAFDLKFQSETLTQRILLHTSVDAVRRSDSRCVGAACSYVSWVSQQPVSRCITTDMAPPRIHIHIRIHEHEHEHGTRVHRAMTAVALHPKARRRGRWFGGDPSLSRHTCSTVHCVNVLCFAKEAGDIQAQS